MEVDEDDELDYWDIEYVKELESSLVRLDYVQKFPAWGRGRSSCPPKPSDYQELLPGGGFFARTQPAASKVKKGRGSAAYRSNQLQVPNGDDDVLPAVGLQNISGRPSYNSQRTKEQPEIENQFLNVEELISWVTSKAEANIVTPSQSNLHNHIVDDRSSPTSASDFRSPSKPNALSVSVTNGRSSPQTVDDLKKDLSYVSYDAFAIEAGRCPSSNAVLSPANSESTKSIEKSDSEDHPLCASDFSMPPDEETTTKLVGQSSAGRKRVPLSTMLSKMDLEAKVSTANCTNVQSNANSASTKNGDSELTISEVIPSEKVVLPDAAAPAAAAASRKVIVSLQAMSPVKSVSIPTAKKPVVQTYDLPSCDVDVAAVPTSPNKSDNSNLLKSGASPVKKVAAVTHTNVPSKVPTVKSPQKSKVKKEIASAANSAQSFRAPSKFMKNDVFELPKFKEFSFTWPTKTPDPRSNDADSCAIPAVSSTKSFPTFTAKAQQTIDSSAPKTGKLKALLKKSEISTPLFKLPEPPARIPSRTESSCGMNSYFESGSSVEIAIPPIKAKPQPVQKKTLRNLSATAEATSTALTAMDSDECKSSRTVPKTWEEAQLLNPVKFDEYGRAIIPKMQKFCLAQDFPSLPVSQEPKLDPVLPTPAPTKQVTMAQLPVIKTSKRKKKKKQSNADKEERRVVDVSTAVDLDKIKDLRVSDSVADKKRRTIVVDNLTKDTSKGVLHECLECFGVIEDIRMVHLPYGRRAEVTFIGEVNVDWVIDIMHNSSLSAGAKPLCVWDKDASVAID